MGDIEQSGQDRLRYKIRRLFSGEGVPIDSGVTQLVGDIYIDEDSGSHYEWSGSDWTLKFTVMGAGGGGLSQEQIAAAFNLTPGVKVYRALFYQSGTDAPTTTEVENTIGPVTLARAGTGVYTLSIAGDFPSGKTFLKLGNQIPNAGAPDTVISINRQHPGVVYLITKSEGVAVDDVLFEAPVEILLYP